MRKGKVITHCLTGTIGIKFSIRCAGVQCGKKALLLQTNANMDEDLYLYHEKMRLLNEQYEALRADENAWEQELIEREELEGTLMDGLEIE